MNEKSAYNQNLRIIATIIVVLGHATMLYDNWGYINVNHEQSDFFMKMRYYICFVQMPLFFSLSGYLQSYINSLTIPSPVYASLVKKLKRLFIPYFFISCTFLLVARLIVGYIGWTNITIEGAIENIVLMKYDGHLWFLVALFYIFVFYYVLSCRLKFTSILVVSLFMNLVANYVPDFMHLNDGFRYFFWFNIGFLLFKYRKMNEWKILFGIVLAIVVILDHLLEISSYHYGYVLLRYVYPMLFLPLIYGLIPMKLFPLGNLLDKNSFAIYLFHIPFIYILFYTLGDQNPFIVVGLCVIVSLVVPVSLANFLRLLNLQYLIGERKYK